MITMFKKFIADESAFDMYVTGPAGTGKTHGLAESVQHCINTETPYLVCAFTHKACGILASKLPLGARITTIDSFLKRRPGINEHAVDTKQIDITLKSTISSVPEVVFIDEYSMIGEDVGADLASVQDPDYTGVPVFKTVWLGDSNQLPPVGDTAYVRPYGDYQLKLTKQYRNNNPLQVPLNELIGMINGAEPAPLTSNANFVRGQNIVKTYLEKQKLNTDQVLLAYTNERVQQLNALIAGKSKPDVSDQVHCPTDREIYTIEAFLSSKEVEEIDTPHSGVLPLNSKYKTLEWLIKSNMGDFVNLVDANGALRTYAYVFGNYNYKIKLQELKAAAAKSNTDIEQKFKGHKAAAWSKFNPKHKLARARAKAWRDFLTFSECVVCLDFPHAMTVHKSQGSTFDVALVDFEDLRKCADKNFMLYLKLAYVAVSRARFLVITN